MRNFCNPYAKNWAFFVIFRAGVSKNDERFAFQAKLKPKMAKNTEFLDFFGPQVGEKHKRFAQNEKNSKNVEFLALCGKKCVFVWGIAHFFGRQKMTIFPEFLALFSISCVIYGVFEQLFEKWAFSPNFWERRCEKAVIYGILCAFLGLPGGGSPDVPGEQWINPNVERPR